MSQELTLAQVWAEGFKAGTDFGMSLGEYAIAAGNAIANGTGGILEWPTVPENPYLKKEENGMI